MDYVALIVSFLTLIYTGLHGLMFERYMEQTLGGCPRLLFDRSRQEFYLKWTCLKCGQTYKTTVNGGLNDLRHLLDDTKRYVKCEKCI